MQSEWREYIFKELLIEPVRNGIYKKKEYHGRGAKIVNMGELFGNPRLFDVDMKRVEIIDSEKKKVLLEKGDLIFARRSLTAEGAGKCCVIKEINEPTTFESSIIRARPNSKLADSDFLFYLFSSPYGKYLLGTIRRQVAVAGITGTDLQNLKLKLPPLPEQKAIAYILGSLDDKIELNRKMNETLEAMAQALFKSWFVDFDPVIDNALIAGNSIPEELQEKAEARKAKLEEKYGSLSAAASHLSSQTSNFKLLPSNFPSEFVQTEEMWPIPKGWKISKIGNEVSCVGGATPNTKNPDFWDNGEIYWTTPKDLSNQSTKILLDTDRKITQAGLNQISSGLLSENTVLMSSRAPVGYLALAKIPLAINQGYIAMKCEKSLTPEFVIQWTESVMDDIKQRAGGTTFAEISKKSFREIPVLVPTVESVTKYSNIVKGYYDRVAESEIQINKLASLRDTLLPKLLSGEIRIQDAEELWGKE